MGYDDLIYILKKRNNSYDKPNKKKYLIIYSWWMSSNRANSIITKIKGVNQGK